MGTAQPRSIALTGSRSRTSRHRLLGHLLFGLASWLALVALWFWQLKIYVPSDWLGAVELIFALFAGWACFSVGWVAWCQSIYRRRHRRTVPLTRDIDFSHDTLGRRIIASPGIKEAPGQLIISLAEDNVKRYQPAAQSTRKRPLPARGDGHEVARRQKKVVA